MGRGHRPAATSVGEPVVFVLAGGGPVALGDRVSGSSILTTGRPRAGARARMEWAQPAARLTAAVLVGIGGLLVAALVAELAAPPAAPGPFPGFGPLSLAAHHDFLAFWAAGSLVFRGVATSIYDPAAITAVQRSVVPFPVGANGYMPFINPPFVAVAMAPLAALPEPIARAAWTVANAALALGAATWIARALRGWERIAGIITIALGFVAYHALAEGQWSVVMLVASLVAVAAARRGSWAVAGLALSFLLIKPQLFLLAMLLLAVGGRWRAIAWALAGGVGLVLVSLPVTGPALYVEYVRYLVAVVASHFSGAGAVGANAWQGSVATMEGLNGLLVGLLGQGAVRLVDGLWGVLVAGVVGAWLLVVRRSGMRLGTPAGRIVLAAGIAVALLVNPNLYAQDCVLVLLLAETLAPDGSGPNLGTVVGVTALAALVLLDQAVEPWHLFPLVLLVAVLGLALRTLSGGGVRPRARSMVDAETAVGPEVA